MNELEDRYAIRELVEGWSDGANHRDWAALEALFTDDAVWDVGAPLSFQAQGARPIVALLREKMEVAEFVVQTPHAPRIWLNGHSARARTTIHEICRFRDGAGLEMRGTYYDELLRLAQGWRFRRRVFRVTCFNAVAPAGQAFSEGQQLWPER